MEYKEWPPEPLLRKLSKEELEEILKGHEVWLQAGMDERSPGRANFSRTDLRGHELDGTVLPKAIFLEANLQGVRLNRANIQEANFAYANLQEANLDGADLRGAHLGRANLEKAHLEGTQMNHAFLMDANLRGATLRYANLQDSKFWDADLSKANLYRADVRRSELFQANLLDANLILADFSEANLAGALIRARLLRHTNFFTALNIDSNQLGGLDLEAAVLPAEVAKFEGLKTVDEAAKKGSHLFTILLLCCLFAWLTVGFGVIAPQGGSYLLPFFQNANMKESGFLLLAPAFILGLFFYFQMYLQRLWEQLALMPAIFPDGSPLDKKAHPWLPIGYVRAHVKVLRANRPPLSKLQTALIQATVFWAAPASVALFWANSLQREPSLAIVWQATLAWLACLIAEAFIYQARHTLRREDAPPYRDAAKSLRVRIWAFLDHHAWAAARLFICAELLVGLSIRLWPS